ncbi:MepB family protein [Arthrobacter sp. D1-29]
MLLPPDLVLTLAEYTALGLAWSEPTAAPESADYGAHTFAVHGQTAVFRSARTTPTKIGQFVTLWQRSEAGARPIRPFDTSDGIDIFVVSTRCGGELGQFVFPQAALVLGGVVSKDFDGGKRALRVYPPWSHPTSRTALATQGWQLEHYFPIPDPLQGVSGVLSPRSGRGASSTAP